MKISSDPLENVEVGADERHTWLVLLPLVSTALYYLLPDALQANLAVQFLPQVLSYFGFVFWIQYNGNILTRLGLLRRQFRQGLWRGGLVGLCLGILNCVVILWIVPWLGQSIDFLKETPHARVPTLVMVPWFIVFIATAVELNFRGFILGRLIAFGKGLEIKAGGRSTARTKMVSVSAVGLSALVFACDPFMVSTFRSLHWIAVWDGVIWGWFWLRLRNLFATIVAHSVEVIILYLTVKAALT